jgi:hypothetical protein
VIDAKGRLFGVINLIDLASVLLIALVTALGVFSYRVFRIPAPIVDRVEPAMVAAAKGSRVRLIGHNFRHYLRAFAPKAGEPFAVTPSLPAGPEASIVSVTENALELQLPDLRPGAYDLYLFDNARQLVHLPSAVTFAPPTLPRATLRATVRLLLPAGAADQLHVGDRDVGAQASAGEPVETAQIEKIDLRRERVDVMDVRLAQQSPGDHYLWMGNHNEQVIADAILRVPVVANVPGRWDYKDRPVRAGEEFVIETPAAKFRGVVVTRDEPELAR